MTDTNECASDPCDGNATCTNHAGTYACECNLGYTGNGHNCSGKSKRKRILRKQTFICIFILISGEFSTHHFNIWLYVYSFWIIVLLIVMTYLFKEHGINF